MTTQEKLEFIKKKTEDVMRLIGETCTINNIDIEISALACSAIMLNYIRLNRGFSKKEAIEILTLMVEENYTHNQSSSNRNIKDSNVNAADKS